MTTHELKIWPEYFRPVIERRKTFEIRYNDRDFSVGDVLHLREWDPETREYTGAHATARVTYIMRSPHGFAGFELGGRVIMSIDLTCWQGLTDVEEDILNNPLVTQGRTGGEH